MSFSNERGQYGSRLLIGADASPTGSAGSSKLPLMLGVVGLAAVGLAVLGARAAAENRPRLTAHEKEVRAWETEFPGLVEDRPREAVLKARQVGVGWDRTSTKLQFCPRAL